MSRIKVRLYRPFSDQALYGRRFQRSVRKIAILDRTKEAGAAGDRYISMWSTRFMKDFSMARSLKTSSRR